MAVVAGIGMGARPRVQLNIRVVKRRDAYSASQIQGRMRRQTATAIRGQIKEEAHKRGGLKREGGKGGVRVGCEKGRCEREV